MKKQDLKNYVLNEVQRMCDEDDDRIVYLFQELDYFNLRDRIKEYEKKMDELQIKHLELKLKWPLNKSSQYTLEIDEYEKKISDLEEAHKKINIKKLKQLFL